MKKSVIPVSCAAAVWTSCHALQAEQPVPVANQFPLSSLRLLNGAFEERQDLNARYLLEIADTRDPRDLELAGTILDHDAILNPTERGRIGSMVSTPIPKSRKSSDSPVNTSLPESLNTPHAIPPILIRGRSSVNITLAAATGRVSTFGLRIVGAESVRSEEWSVRQR